MTIVKKILCLIVCCSFYVVFAQSQNATYRPNMNKINQVLQTINDSYVDTVDFTPLINSTIESVLKDLDPHSAYIQKTDVQKANEPLQGKFEGIGVRFQLIKDTISVEEVIIGGPSEKVGLLAGDKIIKVDTSNATGKTINVNWVANHLRGSKGSKVKVTVKRFGQKSPLEFVITRDVIPLNSIDIYYMVKPEIGYLKLDRFAETTMNEFHDALTSLKNEGMKHLILDLRGNGGGYLMVAWQLADEFLSANKLIVYTDKVIPGAFRHNYFSTNKGDFEDGRLIILIDENSASASEIVSGAIQDWDRGLIIGRRSFGKGLVQSQITLLDNSLLRLTTARYYTPSGRCIQKPYDAGTDAYHKDLNERYKHGEFVHPDSIVFPDSLKFQTHNARTVYGGGGIMPDIFIPMDTSKVTSFYYKLFRNGLFSSFTSSYLEQQRQTLKQRYPTASIFQQKNKNIDSLYLQFMQFVKKEGVENKPEVYFTDRLNEYITNNKSKLDSVYNSQEALSNPQLMEDFATYLTEDLAKYNNPELQQYTDNLIKKQLMFNFIRTLYSFSDAYKYWLSDDETLQKATELIQNEKVFKNNKISYK